ncbi:hypothetical protein [Alkalicoccobacillus plakortidis]|uniref:Uncharacterized protein n=1 Tax=Alkalicoccobacillus plakortidis TaxID=444060 RepID=A0ABT0XQ13_9BACI|nr:hypothetical protein [Alkalicoccobacillus plakortidis]MCM2677428.1 hypothetical protein [Alkalicoccobacillus plakortidis]
MKDCELKCKNDVVPKKEGFDFIMKKLASVLVASTMVAFFGGDLASAESSDRNYLINEKGFDSEFIEDAHDDVIKELITKDSVPVDLDIERETIYHSLDGKSYEQTEDNKEEIDKIRERDIKLHNEENPDEQVLVDQGSSIMRDWNSQVNFGSFYGGTNIAYFGKKGNEHEYKIFGQWMYDSPVSFYNGYDTLGLLWGNKLTGISNSETAYAWVKAFNADGHYMRDNSHNISVTPEVYGAYADIKVSTASEQGAEFGYEVRVPDRYDGDTESVVTAWAHPYFNGSVGVNIGPGSINFDNFSGDEERWRTNFTIGGSPN